MNSIGGTVTQALSLNTELAEALALVHDIGHPPFGHAGEMRLHELMSDYGDRFDHNLHALRIVEQFEKELDRRMGLADAQISSARELGDAEKHTLEVEIAKLTGKRVRAQYGLDPSLLGGAVVRIGSTIYDGSVKGQLEKIKEAISS